MEEQQSNKTEVKRTEYEALRLFATVMASTQDLSMFAEAIIKTEKEKWRLYFEISTGNPVKQENKQLLCQILNFVRLMEIFEIKVAPEMLSISLNLSIIAKSGKMPPVGPNFELYICKNPNAIGNIGEKVIDDFDLKMENLWALWFYEIQLSTYTNGEATRKIPKIFLGENAKFTEKCLMQKSGKKPILQRIIEWEINYPGEITSFIMDIWIKFPALRPYMIEYGYKN